MSQNFRGGGRGEVGPKPFDFVEANTQPVRETPIFHDKQQGKTVSGRFNLHLRTLTPLHIGSGITELSSRLSISQSDKNSFPLVISFMTGAEGKKIIPGSSLKGAIRAAYEAITRSCVSTDRRNSCFRPKENYCPACRLFGAMGYLSRVRFSEALQTGNNVEIRRLPHQFSPRNTDGRKFYFNGKPATGEAPVEVVPEGEEFVFNLDFENLQPQEIGGLLLAMAFVPIDGQDFRLKLGGYKPRGLGTVEFSLERVELWSTVASLQYDESATELFTVSSEIEGKIKEWVALARNGFILEPNLKKLADILKYPNDFIAPSGIY